MFRARQLSDARKLLLALTLTLLGFLVSLLLRTSLLALLAFLLALCAGLLLLVTPLALLVFDPSLARFLFGRRDGGLDHLPQRGRLDAVLLGDLALLQVEPPFCRRQTGQPLHFNLQAMGTFLGGGFRLGAGEVHDLRWGLAFGRAHDTAAPRLRRTGFGCA